MEALIARYGRPRIWATIDVAVLLLVVVVRAVWSSIGPDPIGVAEALEQGGHVVIVESVARVSCLSSGQYKVITQAGRPPVRSAGDLSEGRAEVVVGPDWIGNIEIILGPWWDRHSVLSELIGEPFGWEPRYVHVRDC